LRRRKILVIGYGNPGRLDDGLGPACAEQIEALGLPGVSVDADYQLNVEHAAAAARHDVVVFADASVDGEAPFSFTPLAPAAEIGFTSHSVAPAAVLAVARTLFDSGVQGFALGIRGYRFNEFGEALSRRARQNLSAAVGFLDEIIRGDRFGEFAGGAESDVPEEPRVVIDVTRADMN